MSKVATTYSAFQGGWSGDIKQGADGTFWYSRQIDFRKAPSQISILPGMSKETEDVVSALVTDMIQLPSGKMMAIDNAGGIYSRATNAVWTKNGEELPDTAYGMVYNLQQDTIYIPGRTTIHSITGADGKFAGSTLTVNENAIKAIQDKASTTGHANIWTVPTALNENAKVSFTPTVEPAYSITVWVQTKGAADLILTLHDAANNVLGTVTIPNASINGNSFNEFVFTLPVRMYAKPNAATYHFHIHQGVGTASTIGTATSETFSTADYYTKANRLISPINGFHPVEEFLQYILIGNANYVAAWEPISQTNPSTTEFNQHRLTFPSGYEVTSFALFNEFIAIATEKRSTSATNEYQLGKIFLWDGTAVTYNSIIDVPEGSPYGLFSHRNVLYWFANGGWWASSGGSPVKIFQMPNTDTEFSATSTYMVNYPKSMAVRNSILMGIFPSETSSTTIEHGIYSFGRRNKNYQDSFGFSYTMSTGALVNGTSTLRLGMIKSFGDKMFLSWRNGDSYGVDVVDPNVLPAQTATWESLVTDLLNASNNSRQGRPDREKLLVSMTVVFEELPVGCTVTPKYKVNREAAWVTETGVVGTAGQTEVKLSINKRYKEMQVGIDLAATTTTPKVRGIILVTDNLQQESD